MCVPHQNFTFASKIFNFNKKKNEMFSATCFLQNFRRERTVFHFYFFKENGKSEAVFQHF
jgi:hypothetical protein